MSRVTSSRPPAKRCSDPRQHERCRGHGPDKVTTDLPRSLHAHVLFSRSCKRKATTESRRRNCCSRSCASLRTSERSTTAAAPQGHADRHAHDPDVRRRNPQPADAGARRRREWVAVVCHRPSFAQDLRVGPEPARDGRISIEEGRSLRVRARHRGRRARRCQVKGTMESGAALVVSAGRRDPEIVLVAVRVARAEYWLVPRTRLSRVVGMVKAMLTGKRHEAGKARRFGSAPAAGLKCEISCDSGNERTTAVVCSVKVPSRVHTLASVCLIAAVDTGAQPTRGVSVWPTLPRLRSTRARQSSFWILTTTGLSSTGALRTGASETSTARSEITMRRSG